MFASEDADRFSEKFERDVTGVFVDTGAEERGEAFGAGEAGVDFGFGAQLRALHGICLDLEGNLALGLGVVAYENASEGASANRVLHAVPRGEDRVHLLSSGRTGKHIQNFTMIFGKF